jgi:hypothetical protein
MERHAFLYLKKQLEKSGWRLFNRKSIGGYCYDCIAWKTEDCTGPPDLAVEMYFSIPKQGKYELNHIGSKTSDMVERLESIDARSKWIVIGVPHNSSIEVKERPRPDINIVYQEYKIKRLQVKKRTALAPAP